MVDIQGFRILSKIHESAGSIIWHAMRSRDQKPVIVKLLNKEYPTMSELNRFRREYEIIRILDNIPGVIGGYGIEAHKNSLMMLLEYMDGEPLKKRIRPTGMPLYEALPIFIAITGILGRIHQKNVIHKDLNPANILMNPSTGEIKVIDFGLSTVLSLENPEAKDPGEIEGSLAYISPEQTGRMNRSLDYRTDFYSLGVMFYEILTGRLPFAGPDPVEMIHCHLAKSPTSPRQLNRNIPAVLSDIVTQLMAKTAGERYQSAWGIQHDLRQCLEGLGPAGAIAPFALGLQDIPDRFQLPGKLYGRDREIDRLLEAFDRAAGGRREMVLVHGPSGIGKSFLAREMSKPVALRKGCYIYGKFDELHKNFPYSALIDALRDLIRQILTENETELDRWRNGLFKAFGGHGKLIIDVIPEVELIVGPQPPVHELPPTEARNRFNLVFEKFIKTFIRPDRPLAVFLDDLQWADAATLKLIERIMTDETTGFLLLIGAYRDNETGPEHLLAATVETLDKNAVALDRVCLSPLSLHHTCRLVADTLHRSIESVRSLAELVSSRTGGNPFFINQFLITLYQEKLIDFQPSGQKGTVSRWVWDMPRIIEMGITENVVDLMVMKMKRLPDPTQQVLLLAACVGNRFDLRTLAAIHEQETSETFRRLLPAVQQEFVLTASDLSVAESGHGNGDSQLLVHEFVFSHDRVRQAAYAMAPDALKQQIHFKIAKLFLKDMTAGEQNERIFELAGHLNLGRSLITSNAERYQLANISLRACKKAKYATAYASAAEYCSRGMDALSGIEAEFRDLALELYEQAAVCEYLNGNYDRLEIITDLGLAMAASAVEKAAFYSILIVKSTMLGEHEAAVDYARTALAFLNIYLPEDDSQAAIHRECSEVRMRLGDRPIHSLIDAPKMVQPEKIAAMKIFNNLTPAAYFHHPRLYSWMCAKMANLSLEYGHTPESGKGYTSYGNVLSAELGEFRAGYEFGMLGRRLSEKHNHISYKCRCCFVISAFLTHWVRHIRETEAIGEQGYRAGLESGELLYAGYILAFNNTMNAFFRGKDLALLMADLEKNLLFVKKTNNRLAIDVMSTFRIGLLYLMGRAEGRLSVEADEITGELDPETERVEPSPTVNGFWYVQKTMLFTMYENPSAALHWAAQAEKRMDYISGTISVVTLNFYRSLALAALFEDVAPGEKSKYLRQLAANQKQMKIWADNCPENFRHLYLLVAAESARISGDTAAAADLYDEAGKSASESGFIHHGALANELAAKFWLARGKHKIARLYLADALYGYRLWGAGHKAAHLEKKYPFVSAEAAGPASDSSSSGMSKSLDLTAVMKAAQIISGEIRLKNLVEKIMDIVMKNAGAENGALILKKDKSLMVEARVFEEDPLKTFFTSISLAECDSLSLSIVQYVSRTRENVVLNDAAGDPRFGQDPYVLKTRPRSVLCIPVLRHGDLSGILYLENNKMTGAFTPERVQVLKLLAAQAAVSIENAKLYTTYKSLYDNAIEGMFQSTPRGRFLTANPSMAKILGYESPDELIKSMTDIGNQLYDNPNDRKRVMELLDRDGRLVGFETRFLRKDSSAIWCSLSARKVCDSLGNVLYYEGTVVDITSRKEKEESQRQREIAEKSTQTKSEFLANMSHEIRTPMNAIVGLAYLVQNTNLTPDQMDYVSKIRSAAQSLLRIINDILDFSKMEAGKLDLEYIDFDLGEVLEQLSSLMNLQEAEKEVELVFDVAPDVPYALRGDPVRLGQILVNLVNNAIKFTEAGQIIVKARRMDQAEAYGADRVGLTFSVSDTGIGMTQLQMDGLFRPFSQVDGSSTRRYGGTGLGLSICKQLVEMMDGEIRVESEPGKGSVFTFRVWLGRKAPELAGHPAAQPGLSGRRVPAVDDRPPSGAMDRDVPSPKRISGTKVLLAEDNKINQQVATEILEQFGFDVTIAANGLEALKAFELTQFDLVLMDIQMPALDGYRATKAIRTMEKTRKNGTGRIPIIAITAHAMAGEREKCLNAGMDDYIAKPIEPDMLFAKIVHWIKPGRIQGEPEASTRKKTDNSGFPDNLPGIDIESGLDRLAGNRDLYKELLLHFKTEYSAVCDDIAVSMDKGHIERAKELIHKVRGIAGNLGAYDLFRSSADFETAIGQGRTDHAEALIADLKKKLDQVIHSIQVLENQPRVKADTSEIKSLAEVDLKLVQAALKECAELLGSDFVQAQNRAAELIQALCNSAVMEHVQRLETRMREFDIYGARESLREIARNLNISF